MTGGTQDKTKFLDRLARDSGLAIVVLDAEAREITAANNNSICDEFYGSAGFGPRCAEFCGRAFELAQEAGGATEYECHAGLRCKAIRVSDRGNEFVAIVGRAFSRVDAYRKATEKARSGEWGDTSQLFDNVLISGSDAALERAAARLARFGEDERGNVLDLGSKSVAPVEELRPEAVGGTQQRLKKLSRADVSAWRSELGSLLDSHHAEACRRVLEHVRSRYRLKSVSWLEHRDDLLVSVASDSRAGSVSVRIEAAPQIAAFAAAAAAGTSEVIDAGGGKRLEVFPAFVGDDLRAALAVEGRIKDENTRAAIGRVVRSVAPQIEILRLREDVERRDWIARTLRRFNEGLRQIDTEAIWRHITEITAEMLRAERASLLVYGEKTERLSAKAAVGARIDLESESDVGARISQVVLNAGKPVVVSDITGVGLEAAPTEWSYKTRSFISYPILIGDRPLGVLNFTDRAGGETFTDADLDLLHAVIPQVAVAMDRTSLKEKAGEFEQLSVTDPLTGLLNRRYIEERLAEEITRSKRYRFPTSLMMMDVDEFKSYNDKYGHPAGDTALKLVAEVLKDSLRGADVAARYGGEEFAILLPQTSSEEAAAIAERVRQRIERTEFPKRRVTVSIGIASCTTEINTARDLVSAADIALYEAKNHGRNNVQVFKDLGNSLNEKIH
jgi:diguanylate cyclase (GGDEF)-like protein